MLSLLRPRFLVLAALLAWAGATAPIAVAQNVYFVGKTQRYVQTSTAGAVPQTTGGFTFSASAGTNVTLTLPAGTTLPLIRPPGNDEYEIEQAFATKAALDAAFPIGSYRMTGAGIPTALTFNLSTDAYPVATPQITGGNWNAGGLLVVDPTQTTTITFSTFSGYANTGVAGHIATQVRGLTDNVELETEVGSQAVFGLTLATTPITTITIPAGRLTSGRAYEASVQFDTLTTLDTTSIPGGGAVALFGKELRFYVAAQTGNTTTPPPVIVTQPANQTGVLGGTVSFNLGVTVGGSNQLNNLASRWFFNGQEIQLDGGKYRFSTNGFGVTVTNITAADVGTYSVMLINAGGIVTSANATLALGTATGPAFSRQPFSQTITPGSTVIFTAAVAAVPAPTFQWRLNGVDLPNQTGPTLLLVNAVAANAGAYTVVATNASGSTTSAVATLTLQATNDPGRLVNLSILTPLVAGEVMTMGTVLGGGGTSGAKPLLARAAGPSLAPLGVNPFLPDPTMALVSTSVTPAVTVATNNDWSGTAALSAAFTSVGAFAYLAPTSRDAAIFQPALAPGNYTVQVNDAGTGTGTVIAELYDATASGTFTSTTPRLVNVSVLKTIATGTSLTAGFYVGGSTSKTVLIRAIGPALGLAPFNIAGSMADPQLTLFNGNQAVIATNNDWGGSPQLVNTASRIGAFAVGNGASRDAMLLITLEPGSYTANVSPVGTTAGGTAIVEVYEVP